MSSGHERTASQVSAEQLDAVPVDWGVFPVFYSGA
jgi:hypothetical protein